MKPILLALFLMMVPVVCLYGQTEHFYYGPNTRPVESIEKAVSFKLVSQKSRDRYAVKTFCRSNDKWVRIQTEHIRIRDDTIQQVKFRGNNLFPGKRFRIIHKTDSLCTFEEKQDGITLRRGTASRLIPLHLEGTVIEYHSNGTVRSVSWYRNNQLVSNRNWLRDGSEYIDSIFYSADKEPEFRQGNRFFRSYILANLNQSGFDLSQIADEVVIGWVVMETGEIEGVIILQGRYKPMNDFLVKTINNLPGEWKPAMLNGSPVRYFMTIPLNFRQNDASFQNVDLYGGYLHYNRY